MKFLVLLALPLLAGCLTDQGRVFRDVSASKATEAAKQHLYNSRWIFCRAQSVGAVLDEIGDDPEEWRAYLRACGYTGRAIEPPADL